jgi:cytochrome b subunit of formate dehydrogenase
MPLLLLLAGLFFPALGTQAQELDCSTCHEIDQEKFAASVHSFFACTDCHSGAAEFPHPEGVGQVDCAVCHADAVESYQQSIHGTGRARGVTEAATCTDCHGDIHAITPHTEEASSVHWLHLAESCARCHADVEMAAKFHFTVVRPVEAYLASAHARAVAEGRHGAVCSDCHGNHAIFPAADPRSRVFHQRVPETCGACHNEIAAAFNESVHGAAAARGIRDAPVCTDCHGEHRILSPQEPGSPVFPTNIPLQTCGRCHNDVRLTEKYGLALDKVPAYEDSYHGLAARAGVQTVANCASCHGVHDIQPSSDPRSHVSAANLAETCGQCHPGAGTRYALGPVHVLPTEAQFAVVYYIRIAYLTLIFVVIGGMLVHNLLDFVRKARAPAVRNLAGVPAEEERMRLAFRLVHGLVVISFSTLVYTGFALKYPESWWAQPIVHWESSLGLRGWLHRAAAVVLLAALVGHLIDLARSPRARACIAAMRPTWHDWREFCERARYYLGLRKEPPPAGKLGYIEKSEYLAFMWGTVIMALTGFLLWFENFTLRWFPKWISDAATAVHFYEAILATLAILVWHFYWVIFDPAVYPMDASWWTGRAPLSRALERIGGHYPQAPTAPAGTASRKGDGKSEEME